MAAGPFARTGAPGRQDAHSFGYCNACRTSAVVKDVPASESDSLRHTRTRMSSSSRKTISDYLRNAMKEPESPYPIPSVFWKSLNKRPPELDVGSVSNHRFDFFAYFFFTRLHAAPLFAARLTNPSHYRAP